MPSPDNSLVHQSGLAAYCRTGRLTPIPGLERENVTHYRRLVLNVIEDMLENAYPLTRELLNKRVWQRLVNEFFTRHPCQSPQVWLMPKEFYHWLCDSDHPLLKNHPFLKDLLLFEWIEVELFMMEDKKMVKARSGDILSDKLILNPEHELLSLDYPVHTKNAKTITDRDKSKYFIVAHRDQLGDVIFTDCSAALIRMIEWLCGTPLSLSDLFETFFKEYGVYPDPGARAVITAFFNNALRQGLITGFA